MYKRYFDLGDMFQAATGVKSTSVNTLSPKAYKSNYGIISFCKDLLEATAEPTLQMEEEEESVTLFQDYIFPRFIEAFFNYIYVEDESDTVMDPHELIIKSDENKHEFNYRAGRMLNWYRQTRERYKVILKAIRDNKDKLMDGLKVTTKDRTNTTPQTSNIDPYDNAYTNSSSVSETESDIATRMAMLRELENQLFDAWDKWAEEFRSQVIRY